MLLKRIDRRRRWQTRDKHITVMPGMHKRSCVSPLVPVYEQTRHKLRRMDKHRIPVSDYLCTLALACPLASSASVF